MSSELKSLQEQLAFETGVLEYAKKVAKEDPSPANRADLREARFHVRLLKGAIEHERERLAPLH
jgi:hypothetical protein